MTLNTYIYLTGEIAPQDAFDLGLASLMKAAGREEEDLTSIIRRDLIKGEFPDWLTPERIEQFTDDLRERMRNTSSELGTALGQGLPGIVELEYDPEGPLAPEPQRYETDDASEEASIAHPAHDMRLSWDTGYGYSVSGMGCADLHGQALIYLAQSLPQGVALAWKNEYTGEIHEGVTEADLRQFTRNGLNASEWFTTVVKPSVNALAAQSGSEVQW